MKNITQLPNMLMKDIEIYLVEIFTDQIPIINDLIIEEYRLILYGIDNNADSKVKPEYYEEDLRRILSELSVDDYINIKYNGDTTDIKFIVPDLNSLNLNTAPFLKLIFEGVSGKYVTATAKQFKDAKEKIGSKEPLNPNARVDERVYMIKHTDPQRVRMESKLKLRTGLPPYAFSNMRGIDIFTSANEYVESSISKWMDKSEKMAMDKAKGVYNK